MNTKLLTVGQSVPPIYGIEKATGALRFPADINLPNMLWMKILRSPHAHAKIVAVETTAAERMPGVVAVLTHKDVPRVLFGPYQNEIYPLDEEIRFVGDTVAAVAATDWNVAEEAIRAIRVTYEVLPAVHDPESGVQPGSPAAVLHYPESHELKPGDIRPDQLGTLGNVIGLERRRTDGGKPARGRGEGIRSERRCHREGISPIGGQRCFPRAARLRGHLRKRHVYALVLGAGSLPLTRQYGSRFGLAHGGRTGRVNEPRRRFRCKGHREVRHTLRAPGAEDRTAGKNLVYAGRREP